MMKSSKGIKIECEQKDKENLLVHIFHDLENDYMEKVFSSANSKKIRYECLT